MNQTQSIVMPTAGRYCQKETLRAGRWAKMCMSLQNDGREGVAKIWLRCCALVELCNARAMNKTTKNLDLDS